MTRLEQGQIAQRAGRPSTEVAGFFAEAFATLARIGRVDGIAFSGYLLGQILLRLNQAAEARAPLEASRDALRLLGRADYLAQVEALLARCPPTA